MFIDVLRRYIETLPPHKTGWLAGLRDPHIGKALALIHEQPAHPWTIDTLAKQSGMSRTVFAERFTELVGIPSMHYLAKWRMQVASERLIGGNANLARIAADIGYESEAAFSRAFKRLIGVPPSAWRRDLLERSRGGSRLKRHRECQSAHPRTVRENRRTRSFLQACESTSPMTVPTSDAGSVLRLTAACRRRARRD